jgi:hypothetical protein
MLQISMALQTGLLNFEPHSTLPMLWLLGELRKQSVIAQTYPRDFPIVGDTWCASGRRTHNPMRTGRKRCFE